VIETVLVPFQQWVLFVGVLFVIGCVAWRVLVAPGAMRLLASAYSPQVFEIERRVARAGFVAGLILLGTWVLRMVTQVILFRDPFVPISEDLSFLLFDTFWGTVWMAQGVIIALLAITFWLAAARRTVTGSHETGSPTPRSWTMSPPWWAAAVLVLMLVASLAMSSHAMGVESGRPLIVTADAVHGLAAGIWIGTLGVILTIGRRTFAADSSRDLFAAQIRAFSPMAIVGVIALVSMGTVLAWTHLTTWSDLWTITYGRLLAAKIALTAVVLAVGFVNWRKGIPVLGTESGSRGITRLARVEVGLAMGVIVLTALLVNSVKP